MQFQQNFFIICFHYLKTTIFQNNLQIINIVIKHSTVEANEDVTLAQVKVSPQRKHSHNHSNIIFQTC